MTLSLIINNTAHFFVTNTGNLTTPQLHTALQYTLRHTPQVYKNIVKITHVLQPNQRQRFDLWIKTECAAGLQQLLHLDYKGRLALQTSIEASSLPAQAIQLTSMLPQYRLTRWKAYRDRPPKQDRYLPKPTGPTPKNMLTWNINGLQSKISMLKGLITTIQVGVIAVQEHLWQVHQLTLHIENYVLFEKPKEKEFCGHCVYVHKNIAVHEIDTTCKHIIHLKVFGLTGSKPWNLLANQAMETTTFHPSLYCQRSPSLLYTYGHQLNLTVDKKELSTRRHGNTPERYIDHYIHTPNKTTLNPIIKVDTATTDISDRWPVVMTYSSSPPPPLAPQKKGNKKAISGHGLLLALFNKWDVLQTAEIKGETNLNTQATAWSSTLTKIGEELQFLRYPPSLNDKIHFDRKTADAIKNKSPEYLIHHLAGITPLVISKTSDTTPHLPFLSAAARRKKLSTTNSPKEIFRD
ncbi:hypothetical protein PPACK8108_LOCUS17551 [Phakopsora pachyrhizi]|uniref:Uncharacterized protein n=1 Tax=Phakopsora pachyrhizi TaxID=170000 RepID=A0AAV0BB30_PHAPC|nr:hypothetical protein PPACK8108_LOCUS17551 [Phakopsora pachyrhizi]